ncbi:cation diffusion facilitator family transporter [Sporomusa acidovorans]|uniref:Ferrous-iron efflux pump FieF n=1 Tax=Sporomusa acidovorans (strain ATCC 49682 / DSM 3132 / Mol) TaxID=1123286 RepID=A0ABZ3J115_SPOA4|nr:cation diffusion facilitator family transporter [Sporomusa acidovorans]OZC14437.1 ferrous-iron efflux pump FieF [Sporomusa acidovorans DSM 3132]SDF50498.1 cation diffusion facilitator family transporter [Sporomusa acidovorans]
MSENLNSLKQNTAQLAVIATSLQLILKLVIGIFTGTISIISEAVHSAADLLATLISYCAIRKSSALPDDNHHYGHGKFENISGAFEALLIITAALWILYEAYEKYSNANSPVFLEYGMIIMLFSCVVNYLISQKMLSVAKQTSSPALEADALHLQADIWTSGGILVGLFCLHVTGLSWIDSLIAVIIALIILKTGYSMLKKNISELTDITLPEEEEQLISQIIKQHDQVISLHQLRTRYSGGYRLIDMHLTVDKNMQLDKAHTICDQLEATIKHHFGTCDVMIHVEPDECRLSET